MKKNIRRKTSVLMILTMLLLPVNFAYGAEAEINEEVYTESGSENVIEEANPEQSDENSVNEEASNPVAEESVVAEQSEAPAEAEVSEETVPSDPEQDPSETTPEDQTPREEAFEDISEKKEPEGVSSDEVFEPIETEDKEISISDNFTPVSENSVVSENSSVSDSNVSQNEASASENNAVSENIAVSEDKAVISFDFPAKIEMVVDPFRLKKRERIFSEKYEIINRSKYPITMKLDIGKIQAEKEIDGYFELVIHTDDGESPVISNGKNSVSSMEISLGATGEEGYKKQIWLTGDISEDSPYYHLEKIGGIEELSDTPLDVTLRYTAVQQ